MITSFMENPDPSSMKYFDITLPYYKQRKEAFSARTPLLELEFGSFHSPYRLASSKSPLQYNGPAVKFIEKQLKPLE
jgi:hypothetical protein